MAWVRCCGGSTPRPRLLAKCTDIVPSATKWIVDTAYCGLEKGGYGGGNNPQWYTGISDNVYTADTQAGYSVGLVTRCEANKSYRVTVTTTGGNPGEVLYLYVLFFNGSTFISNTGIENTDTTKTLAFSVPNNATNVILLPYRYNNGVITHTIDSFVEL